MDNNMNIIRQLFIYFLTEITLVLLILSAAVSMFLAMETETRDINLGEMFELQCLTSLQFPVVWRFKQLDETTYDIFLGGEISKGFQEMFNLKENQSLGEYNLLIPSADSRYSGNYKCIDDEGLGSELLSIQLNIMASASTKEMVMIAHQQYEVRHDAVEAAASISQNNMESNSTTVPAVVGCLIGILAIVAVIILIVTRSKWHMKCKGENATSRDVESHSTPSSQPSPLLRNGVLISGLKEPTVESDAREGADAQSSRRPDALKTTSYLQSPDSPPSSPVSVCSTTPLLLRAKERASDMV